MVTTNSLSSEQTFPAESESHLTDAEQRTESIERDLIELIAGLAQAVDQMHGRLTRVELEHKAMKIIHKAHWKAANPDTIQSTRTVEPAEQV